MASSLRLAEAFLRAAAPVGHPPLRDLAALRGHMDSVHGLGVAGMLPQQVLMHMHEKAHEDPESRWSGSADASSNTRFIARRQGKITAMLHYSPHVREVLPYHMLTHHGWTPAEIREAMEWPEAANALPGHHDAEHAQYADPPMEHRIPHAHEDVSFDLDAPAWEPPEVPEHPEAKE